jgi:hypothetical protein
VSMTARPLPPLLTLLAVEPIPLLPLTPAPKRRCAPTRNSLIRISFLTLKSVFCAVIWWFEDFIFRNWEKKLLAYVIFSCFVKNKTNYLIL